MAREGRGGERGAVGHQRFGTRIASPTENDGHESGKLAPVPNILMLGGFGRSGSTLLERCLAQVPGAVGIGEALHLWERALRDDELCGCGESFSECSFWRRIGERAFGGWDSLDVNQLVEDRTDVVRTRYIPQLVTGITPRSRRVRRDTFAAELERLYRATTADGIDLIVDSSKHPAYAYLLHRIDVSLRCVLVVRDPRGVAYSWAKAVRRPEAGATDALMPRYSPAETALKWSVYGMLFHLLPAVGVPVMTVHYEDFMRQPRETIARILRFAGHRFDDAALAHITDGAVHLDHHHTVAGNPMRFATGDVRLTLDDEWRSKMRPLPRAVVGVVTAPMRAFYAVQRALARVTG